MLRYDTPPSARYSYEDCRLSNQNQNQTTFQNKAWQLGASVAAGANVTKVFWQLISRKWEYEPIRQFELSVLLCILCKCNCRRNSSHCKSATQFAPQKYVSLITEKFPKEEGGQWPTSVTHFAKVTYLRPPTRLFHSPTLRRLGLCCDRSKPPRGIDVEQSSPRPDWIQNSQAHPAGRSQKLPPEAEQTSEELTQLPWKKWQPFRRRHFQMHFHEWQIKISLKFIPKGPIDNKSSFVEVMAWRRTGDKPLTEPMLTQFTDAYLRHSASVN